MKSNNEDKWLIQIRKGMFELAILSLLSHKPMYGYEISMALKHSTVFTISEGAIYPILRRMTEKEWIEFFWGESNEGPRRKYYQITEEGRVILEYRIEKYKEMYASLQTLREGGLDTDHGQNGSIH
ncbi:PadR family transcriptional regulator [Melghirimyces algeriensis]|nr:PadR family transcriptional regulator [Melghirimyces algeriensis]